MKHNFTSLYKLLFVFLLFFTFQSCERKEGCTDPNAENYDPSADLENNTCISAREKFVGVYLANDNCNTVQKNYIAEIRKANDNLTDILIYNLHNLDVGPVRARVIGSSIVIPNQSFQGFRRFAGTGSILGNVIQLTFETKLGTSPDNTEENFAFCSSTFTR